MSEQPTSNAGQGPRSLKRGALGKGLNALLGLNDLGEAGPPNKEAEQSSSPDTYANSIVRLYPGDIEPNPHQPRRIFNEEHLTALVQSIQVDGIIQPLIVTRGEKPGRFVLIAGERRWRAAQLAGLETVPVIVKNVASDDMLRIALIENIQRADLNAIEEAEAYASLINDFGLTQDQCAKKVGKERTTVTNSLRLLQLPPEIQDDIMENRVSMGHGRALLSLDDKRKILRARDIVIKKSLNVRQTEQLCKNLKKQEGEPKASAQPKSADLDYLAENLRSHLKTKVKLMGTGSRGKIEISYFSAAELERIISMVGPGRI